MVAAACHIKERRFVVELILGEADLDLNLAGRIVVSATLDPFWVENGQSERVKLCSLTQVKSYSRCCGALRG